METAIVAVQTFISSRDSVRTLASLQAFWETVDWTEPWVLGWIILYVCIFATVVITWCAGSEWHGCISNSLSPGIFHAFSFDYQEQLQGSVLLIDILLLQSFSTRLALIGKLHWRYFTRQPFADTEGTFVLLLYCIPLMLLNVLLMANMVIYGVSLFGGYFCSYGQPKGTSSR